MATLSPKQVGILIAANNWGPGDTIENARKFMDIAIAVCITESGMRTNPPVSATGDHGLWQINKKAHPIYFGMDPKAMENPNLNTAAAKQIWNAAGGWSPWTGSYVNGKYKHNLGHGKKVYDYVNGLTQEQFKAAFERIPDVHAHVTQTGQFGSADIGDAIGAGVDSVTGLAGDITSKILAGAKTAGFWILAIILLILGVIFLMKDTSIGRQATGLVNPTKKLKLLS